MTELNKEKKTDMLILKVMIKNLYNLSDEILSTVVSLIIGVLGTRCWCGGRVKWVKINGIREKLLKYLYTE